MKTTLSALLIVFAFGLASCEKEQPHCDYVSGPSQEFLNYWYFPQDSYWVYELDGAPGVYDTVTVVEAEAKYYNPDKYAARVPCEMQYRQTLAHSNDSIFVPTASNPHSLEKYEAWGESLYLERLFNVSQFAAGVPIFNLPVEEGRQVHSQVVMADTSVFVTADNQIAETVEIENTIPVATNQTNAVAKSFSFTKNVGITQRVYTNGRIWNLVSYHINKQ